LPAAVYNRGYPIWYFKCTSLFLKNTGEIYYKVP
jgi:hypothetical protein